MLPKEKKGKKLLTILKNEIKQHNRIISKFLNKLQILQYSQVPAKPTKGKPEADLGSSTQVPPENLTCHFAFGIDTLHA